MVKVCFGYLQKATLFASDANINYKPETIDCSFCGINGPYSNNYCGNCGKEVPKKAAISPAALASIVENKEKPPYPLKVFPYKDSIFIGQILSEGSEAVIVSPSPNTLAWEPVSIEIRDYLKKQLPLKKSFSIKLMGLEE